MVQSKSILGTRIRERRKELKITQASLAKNLNISASYLNLIEHNKRTIGGSLLLNVANQLKLEINELEDASARRLHTELEEIAHIPYLQSLEIEHSRCGELIGRFPGWSRALQVLARSERDSTAKALSFADRLMQDRYLVNGMQKILGGLAAVRSAGEILVEFSDISKTKRERFQDIIALESRRLTDIVESIASYLEKPADIEGNSTPTEAAESLFEERKNRFEEIENRVNVLVDKTTHQDSSAPFQPDLSINDKTLKRVIHKIIDNYPKLNTELAKQETEKALANYTNYATAAPMERFLPIAQALEYDIEAIAKQLSLSIETVCHRLTALPKSDEIPRFGYLLSNASGMVIQTRNIPTLLIPRFSPACPLWVVFRAQQSPETLIRQRVLFPNGDGFVFVARARLHGETGFGKPRHYLSDMLVMTESSAKQTVYSPDQSVYYEPVGVSCRSCIRKNCQHRVSDPLIGG